MWPSFRRRLVFLRTNASNVCQPLSRRTSGPTSTAVCSNDTANVCYKRIPLSSQLSLISTATTSSAPIFTHTTSSNSISNHNSTPATALSLSSNLNQTHHDVQSTANNTHLIIPTNSHDNQSNSTNTSTVDPSNNSSPLPPQNRSFKINPLNITHPSQYLELLPSIENTYIFDKKLNKVNIL